jgi:nucleoid DNA-binding protein
MISNKERIDKKEICLEIAKELNIPPNKVIKVVNFQFKRMNRAIHFCENIVIKLPYIGKFYLRYKTKKQAERERGDDGN